MVYDAGGPDRRHRAAAEATVGRAATRTLANSWPTPHEAIPVPANLRVPGASLLRHCGLHRHSITDGPTAARPAGSTGRIDPPWVLTEGWQGFSGQNRSSNSARRLTRPARTAASRATSSMPPPVPLTTRNCSCRPVGSPWFRVSPSTSTRKGRRPDGVTPTLNLVDTTKTSSWDDWAQGFRSDGVPNMNCPGQVRHRHERRSLLLLAVQPAELARLVQHVLHGTAASPTALPNNSQFKCYDGMHNWNQLQPAPYDGYVPVPQHRRHEIRQTGEPQGTGRPAATRCDRSPAPTARSA